MERIWDLKNKENLFRFALLVKEPSSRQAGFSIFLHKRQYLFLSLILSLQNSCYNNAQKPLYISYVFLILSV